MMRRWIPVVALVPLLCGTVRANPEKDLEFARKLGVRGLDEMAMKVLDDLEKSSDPAAARAGRYGKALLEKQNASVARYRFLRDLEEGREPRVKREDVLAAFESARPRIQEYVDARKEDLEARFLLAELLQEYAEFLTGSDYPAGMEEKQKELVDANAAQADQLFERTTEHYTAVIEETRKKLPKDVAFGDPLYIQLSRARYKKANARLRWAMLYPSGPKFQFHSSTAIEELDEFYAEHYEDIFGAYALLDLGICNLERGLRLKSEGDAAQIALDYFQTLYDTLEEDPAFPEKGQLVAQAFYWYARTCNALARGDGELEPQPVYLERAIGAGALLRSRLKEGAKTPWALRALLEVAGAYAAQERFEDAVALAGDVLSTARVEGHGNVVATATEKLTAWVANVGGAGTLPPALLYQIGESLGQQGRTANAVTFFEKAISASTTDDQKEDWAYPARVRIARAYLSDKRYFAAAKVARGVLDVYLESGQEEESQLGQIASDACNVARLALREVSRLTKRTQDEQAYDSVLNTFRTRFPGHPENADKDFRVAKEAYQDGDYERAAELLGSIGSTSPNYWLAQRMVPQCYRNLALGLEDQAEAKKWHEKTLEAAQELRALARGKDVPAAERAEQMGHLFVAMAHDSLGNAEKTVEAIDSYLKRYPDQFLKRGLEYKIKIDAHLALGQLDEAESALATFLEKFPSSSYSRRSTYDVYMALRNRYQELGGTQRTKMAERAAALLETWVAGEKDPDANLLYFLGDVLYDAERHVDAADAFEAARDKLPAAEETRRTAFTLRAAEARYNALQSRTDLTANQKLTILNETRDLFTDVIIPPDPTDPAKTAQKEIIRQLGMPDWPKADVFEKIRKNAPALLTAARIFREASPPGVDGRRVALKLIHHLQRFTRPAKTGNPQVDQYTNLWWESAELKLQLHLELARSSAGSAARDEARQGLGFATKIQFEHPKMDGEERVNAVKALAAQLNLLK